LKYRIHLLLLMVVISPSLFAVDYLVSNSSDIYDLINTVQPGDTITMQNGIWEDQHIVFHANGTEDSPILIRTETPGSVRILGNSFLEFSGSWIIIDGLLFKNGYSNSGQGVVEFRSSFGRANNCRLTNTVIADYNPSSKDTDYKWVSMYGKNNRVDHCSFEGKTHSGTTFVVWLSSESDRENYHRIDHNYFGPRPDLGYNGGETIRIGTSNYSMTNSRTIVEYNVFEECSGETEIISNKSCENVYRYNTFIDSEGCLTLRHGNRCEVYGNFFFGHGSGNTGGVRIIGEDHQVYNNYFDGLNGSGYKSALCIVKGVQDSPLNRYFQVQRALVAFNTFINCRNTFNIGYGTSDDQTLPPVDCVIANNTVQTTYQVAQIGDTEGTPVNFTWEGNIFYGSELGISNPGGILWQSPNLQISFDRLYRPSANSPLIGAAVGDYAQIITDVDGQSRSVPFDVGCDEESSELVTITPLFKDDVGVDWFISGPIAVEVTAGKNTLVEALNILGNEDTLKLVTNGGIYQLTEKLIINRKIIISAAKGLTEKPIITRTNISSGDSVLFEMQAYGELCLNGVIIDGGSDKENRMTALIATTSFPFSEYFRVKADNCEFKAIHNGGNCSFLKLFSGTQADSILFSNCTFSDCDGIGIRMNSEETGCGNYNVRNFQLDNCTFWKIKKDAIDIYGGDDSFFSIGPAVKINHCTFDNVGGTEYPVINLRDVDNAVIRNSIISNSARDTAAVLIYGWSFIEYCDLFNSGHVSLNRNAHQYDGMVSYDPKYRDAANGDFTLAFSSPVRGIASDGKALGDLRWAGDVENAIETEPVAMESDFSLSQNYPNPFNGGTQISYTLYRSATVELQIYNITGNLVCAVKKTYSSPGYYTFSWNPENIAAGIYCCRLLTDNQTESIKMLYLK